MESHTDPNPEPKYKLGIALSGGGIRGLAHAGALKAIEEAGLKPDILAGVSAGSVVAVLYAAGLRPEEILELFTNAKFTDFTEFTIKSSGLFKIDKFMKHIMGAIPKYKRFEELPIPTYVGVSDFDSGMPVEFHEGEMSDVIKASCSIPIAIPPVEINGVTYVDGGVLRNLPAWIIRDKCEKLIGINVSPLVKSEPVTSLIDIAMRSYTLLAKSNQQSDMEACDLNIITKELSHYHTFSLKEPETIFLSGYVNARKTLRDAGWWQKS